MNEQTQLTKRERRELKRQEKLDEQKQQRLKRKYRRIAVWSLVAIGIGGVVFGMTKFVSQGPPGQIPHDSPAISVSNNDWIKGNKDAAVTIIEYSDFQCPACGSYYPAVKQLTQEFGDSILFAYRHFPLRQIHKNANLAAQAAEAVGRQGKFWEMHDVIFENQREWSDARNAKKIFIRYAETLNLDIEKFKNDIDSKEIKEQVEEDYRTGLSLKVNSTPSFFLNGEKIQNPRSYEEFKDLIQQAIANTNQQ